MEEANNLAEGVGDQIDNSVNQDTSNVSHETNSDSQPSSDSKDVSNSQKSGSNAQRVLLGDGDIQKAENYIADLDGVSEEIKNKLKERIQYGLKTRQAVADRALAKVKAEQKKYSINDENDLINLIENTPELKEGLSRIASERAKIQEEIQAPNANLEWAAENWHKLNEFEKQDLYSKMTPEQKLTLKNTLILNENKSLEQKMNTEKLHAENKAKYGESYTKKLPELENYFRSNFFKNPTALIYAAMTREEYGKEQYEKGLRERQNGNILNTSINSSSQAVDSFDDPISALRAALKQHNIGDVNKLYG